MIDQFEEKTCNGCQICKEICPVHAISYQENKEGFWFPVVDYTKCIQCGLCIDRCPNKTKLISDKQNPRVMAAWSKDPNIRLASTSGGIFYELAKQMLENGGYVCGCVYDKDFMGAHHTIVHSMDDLPPLMVSKYVESDAEGIYSKIKWLLRDGNKVLFVGSPCQCAGLISFLNNKYDNLILVDFLCRGANSPKAHKKYIEYLEETYNSKVVGLRSKDKRDGWRNFGQAARFENGNEYYATRNEDLRVVAYHRGNLMIRASCLDCKFKSIPRYSDITLGDYWGISAREVEDIDKGISLLFINSEKGQMEFGNIEERIKFLDKTFKDALKGNPSILYSASCSDNREKFLYELDSYPFDVLVNKYKSESQKRRKQYIKRILYKLYKVISHD